MVDHECVSTNTVLSVALVLIVASAIFVSLRIRRVVTTPAERAVHAALSTASLAARALRGGLTEESAEQAAPHLHALIGCAAVGIADTDGRVLAWTGPHTELAGPFEAAARQAVDGGRRVLVSDTSGADAQVLVIVAQPLIVEDSGTAGVLGVVTTSKPGPGLLGAVAEVARYVSGQLELAELDASRARLDRAEVLALRAQISPHFIYNALNTIASFVRTDPERARELVLEFADFTRYSFRSAGEFTVLSEELHNIDRYLTLERARFGDSLQVRLQVAPEVLNVVLPFLALQPLVENAVRHGLAPNVAGGTITIVAADEGTDCVITIEDDGVGMDPDLLRFGALDAVERSGGGATIEIAHVGLANVDDRLRAAFGNDYGLVVETAPGSGTKVFVRVPKFRPGIEV